MPISQQQREQLQQAVVGYLATRQALNFDAPSIKRALTYKRVIDTVIEDEDLQAALALSESLGYVKREHELMGFTVYWKATGEGVLVSGRNGWDV